MRFYVNGTQVGQRAQTGAVLATTSPLRIGGNTIWGEHFAGDIDEVRIYNRALTAAEIQGDMNQPVGVSDTEPPTAPTNLNVTGSLANAQLTWTAATDNVGVVRYNVHRAHHGGLHADRRQPRRPAHRHELHRHPAGRRLLLQGHRRGRLRQRRPCLQRAERAGRRPRRAERARHAQRRRRDRPRDPDAGAPRPTTWASSATTSTARPRPASRRAPPTGSPSPRARASSTPSRPAPTSTRSPPRTRPATSGPPTNEASAVVTVDTQAPTVPAEPHRHDRRARP